MGTRAIASCVEIPPHILHGDVAAGDFAEKLVVVLLTDRTADDFANLGEEDISALNGGAGGEARVITERGGGGGRAGGGGNTVTAEGPSGRSGGFGVLLHVEGFDVAGIVGHDDGLAEMLLHKVALVLGSEVHAPADRELKLMTIADGLLQDFDALGVGQTNELGINNALKTLDEGFVDHLVEELKVVLAVVECPTHAILDEILFEIHEVVEVDECHFGLNHPELSQMAGSVAVLRAECGAKGVDGTESCGAEFAFKLTADGERGHLAEEVVVVDDVPLLVFLQTVEVLGGHLKHLTGTFSVAGSDERRMEIEKAVVVEILVNGDGHVVAYAHDGTKGVGAQTQVSVLAHDLEGLSFFLHGIVGGAGAVDFDGVGLDFRSLPCGGALDESADNGDAGTGGDELEGFGGDDTVAALGATRGSARSSARGTAHLTGIGADDNLDVLDGGTVVESNEIDGFA